MDGISSKKSFSVMQTGREGDGGCNYVVKSAETNQRLSLLGLRQLSVHCTQMVIHQCEVMAVEQCRPAASTTYTLCCIRAVTVPVFVYQYTRVLGSFFEQVPNHIFFNWKRRVEQSSTSAGTQLCSDPITVCSSRSVASRYFTLISS